VAAAAQAQAQAMKDGRSAQASESKNNTGQGMTLGNGNGGNPEDVGNINKGGDWGRLPPQMQRDLMEARHETVSDEYRAQVDAYFRAIAERSRQEQSR
jgi:hypothetical protein